MTRLPHWRRIATIGLFALSLSAAAHAADVNGRIRGTVTDPSGAVVPNANIVATNQQTGVKFTTTAGKSGEYIFQQLPVGTYTISSSASGFKSFSATGIVITIDQEYVEPIKLDLGNASETVEVQADSVQVNTTDMQLNNVVNAAQMEELPLIGRNFTGLELTLPGVQAPSDRFGTFSVSGSQTQQSEFLINGADTNDIALNTLAIAPNLDAIDQFNLIDGPLNAEYDRNSGGIVSATIKQGTNHIHGDVFEFYRDTFLNTNNYFQKYSGTTLQPVSAYHQNIFGGTIGAPIIKDKLFGFFGYQGTHQRVPEETTQNTTYTAAQYAGNFASSVGSFSTNPIPSGVSIPGCVAGQTWASCLNGKGGIVPTASFNAVADKLATTYVPTTATLGGLYTYNATENTTANQYIGRVDYALNPKNQFTVLGIYQTSNLLENLPFTGASVPGFGDSDISHIQQWTADYVRQISASSVNDLAAHYTRFNFDSGAPQQVVQPSTAGFAITPQDPTASTIPTIVVNQGAGAGGFSIGGTNNGPQPRIDQVIQFDDNFSKTLGHHNIKVGYDGRRFNVSNTFDASNSGSYAFNGAGGYSTGVPQLDFLLGIPDTYSQGTGSIIQADAFLNYIYAQDSWKLANNFTLNYGLGYSIDTPLRNHQFGGEAISCFNVGQQSSVFPTAPTNMAFPGDPGCTNAGQAYTRHNEFGPRIGFAWAPDLGPISGGQGRFSIRGGFGIYYDRTEEESALQTLGTPPFGFTSGGAADFGGNPSFTNPYADINGGATTGATGGAGANSEANRFPYVEPVKGQAVNFSALEPIYNIDSFDKSFRSPYAENFQLSVERELPSKIVARLSYVGSLARHNQVGYEGDYETAAGHAACLASATCSSSARRVLQAYYYPSHTIGNSASLIEEGETGSYASSNYNSFQTSITKAPTHGLLFQFSYTYSHAMDTGSSFENTGFGENGARGYNQFQPGLNYGDSAFDVRHRVVFSPVYVAPLIKGKSAFSPISLALSGWEVSAIVTAATGEPFDISYAGSSSNSLYCSIDVSFYACPDVPVQTAPLQRTSIRGTKGRFFANAGFAQEPIGSFGNIHRDPYHGPGINNTNLILAKNFLLSSDSVRRLQIRMESDNVFNHTQFDNPSSAFSSTTVSATGIPSATSGFGVITAAANARQTLLAAKFYF